MSSKPPSTDFAQRAHVKSQEHYLKLYEQSRKNPDEFWSEWSRKLLPWSKPFERSHSLPAKEDHWRKTQWFPGGEINASAACLDQHLSGPRKSKAAIIWEGEDGSTRSLRYGELHEQVCRFAGVLSKLGVQAGDRVAIYLPLIPEAIMAMLACARIGAPHTVIFAGFSADAVRERLNDAGCKLLITADGGFRRGKVVPLKATVDKALEEATSVSTVLVVAHTGKRVAMQAPRDLWLRDLIADAEPVWEPVPFSSDHPLFLLYTSGSTGKPKGILHSTGGYLTGAGLSTHMIFDLKDEDRFWCTADIGWITGHSYLTYGPLINGATIFIYEGTPDYPDCGRFWRMVEKHQITIFYTAPTAIRALIRAGEDLPNRYDLSSLRLLGTVGEPINEEAWLWYHRVNRQRTLPHHRHLVANGNRLDHDHYTSGRTRHKTSSGWVSIFRSRCSRGPRRRNSLQRQRNRNLGSAQPLAFDAAHHLWRRQALRKYVLVQSPWMLSRGGRGLPRRGGVLLDIG